MRLKVEDITPEIAAVYLQKNIRNRHMRKALVSQYARDMKDGKWRLTHQGLAFGMDGMLLDGQHRLAAVIEAECTIQMLVARDVDSKNQIVMDDHAKRSAGDALSLARGERITAVDVAIVRASVELQEKNYAEHKSKTELNELIDKFRNPLVFTAEFLSTKYRGVTAAPVWGAIALAWFYVEDIERLRYFCRLLCGIEMATNEGDRAAVILREWLLRTGVRYSAQRSEAFRKSQRAISAFMKHQKLEKLYGTDVLYPWPLVDPMRT